MAELKRFEYIIEFEPRCLTNDGVEYWTKSVQELVRCRNCEHTERQAESDGSYCLYCKMWDRWEMPLDGFCHYGKEAQPTKKPSEEQNNRKEY